MSSSLQIHRNFPTALLEKYHLPDIQALLPEGAAKTGGVEIEANRAQGLSLALLRRRNAARRNRIDAELATIDREIAARIAADSALTARRAILVSIPGISGIAMDPTF